MSDLNYTPCCKSSFANNSMFETVPAYSARLSFRMSLAETPPVDCQSVPVGA